MLIYSIEDVRRSRLWRDTINRTKGLNYAPAELDILLFKVFRAVNTMQKESIHFYQNLALGRLIQYSFDWDSTPEGFNFWRTIEEGRHVEIHT